MSLPKFNKAIAKHKTDIYNNSYLLKGDSAKESKKLMIFTNIKQAIGSTLLDVKGFSYESNFASFHTMVYVFNTGVYIRERVYNIDDDEYTSTVYKENIYMPEELKELIKQYK